VKTEIKEKVAWDDGRRVQFSSKNYLNCQKWMRTGKIGLFIRSPLDKKPEDGQTTPYGVMIAKPDLEEMFTVVRGGSIVRMNP